MSKDTFNDRMVKKTVIPAIYLWLLASGSVVAMGIWKPDVVLQNLDGFIALIAIIGGVHLRHYKQSFVCGSPSNKLKLTICPLIKNTKELGILLNMNT